MAASSPASRAARRTALPICAGSPSAPPARPSATMSSSHHPDATIESIAFRKYRNACMVCEGVSVQ